MLADCRGRARRAAGRRRSRRAHGSCSCRRRVDFPRVPSRRPCDGWHSRTMATGRRGRPKGFSLVRGWLPAYPETTGYVLGTLLAYGERTRGGRAGSGPRSRWATGRSRSSGPTAPSRVRGQRRRSIVFNTGMVLHGWVDLRNAGTASASRGRAASGRLPGGPPGRDGTWDPDVEYARIPHAYNARVAWALLRLARVSGDARFSAAAPRQLDWVVERQADNGWFGQCVFKPGCTPRTTASPTLRGLLEGHCLTGEDALLDRGGGSRGSRCESSRCMGTCPPTTTRRGRPTSRHECVTGTAQSGGVWLRLFQVTGDARYLNAGLKAVEQAARRQERGRAVAGDTRRARRVVPGLRALRAASVSELGGEVPGGLADAARGLSGRRVRVLLVSRYRGWTRRRGSATRGCSPARACEVAVLYSRRDCRSALAGLGRRHGRRRATVAATPRGDFGCEHGARLPGWAEEQGRS